MKILAFDIGIKNLSYCILDEKYNIIKWGIINVLNHEITGCSKCPKPAKHKENDIYFCGRHKTKTSEKIIFKKVSDFSLFDIQKELVKKLDDNSFLLDIDYVVLENQPRFNIKMKTIAAAVYTYFIIKSKSTKHIHYIHPNDKIKKIDYDGPEFISNKTKKYQRDKETSVVYCKHFLKNDEKNLNYLLTQKQKVDDLTDSYLTARSYLLQLKKNEHKQKLESKTLDELIVIAKEKNIEMKRKPTKKQLVKKLTTECVNI